MKNIYVMSSMSRTATTRAWGAARLVVGSSQEDSQEDSQEEEEEEWEEEESGEESEDEEARPPPTPPRPPHVCFARVFLGWGNKGCAAAPSARPASARRPPPSPLTARRVGSETHLAVAATADRERRRLGRMGGRGRLRGRPLLTAAPPRPFIPARLSVPACQDGSLAVLGLGQRHDQARARTCRFPGVGWAGRPFFKFGRRRCWPESGLRPREAWAGPLGLAFRTRQCPGRGGLSLQAGLVAPRV